MPKILRPNLEFTFRFDAWNFPCVTIRGSRMAIISCQYNWETKDAETLGTANVTVSGYINDELKPRTFQLDLKRWAMTELKGDHK